MKELIGRWRRAAAVAFAHLGAEDAGDVQDAGDDGEREQRERPALQQHDGDDEGRMKTSSKMASTPEVNISLRASTSEVTRVTRRPPDCGRRRRRHALEVAEDLAAQVEHDLLAGPLHQVGLERVRGGR